MGAAIKRARTETRTIMIMDMVGYTKTTAKLTREQLNNLLDFIDATAHPVVAKHQGTIVKKMGDAFLITFPSATDAVQCGVELQRKFAEHSRHGFPTRIRVVIHQGDVLIKENDIYGDAVNTTARIEKTAKPGHVVFTGAVYSNLNKSEIPIIHLGSHEYKGLKHPIRLFRVKSGYDEILARKQRIARIFKTLILLLIIITITLFLGDLFINQLG